MGLLPDLGGGGVGVGVGVAGAGELVGAEGGAGLGLAAGLGLDEGEVGAGDVAGAASGDWGTSTTSAPSARIIRARSVELPALMTATKGCPRTAQTMARPVPMLPEVSSTMVWPGASCRWRRASSTMRRAARSFLEKPGLRWSSLAKEAAVEAKVRG